VPNPLAALVEAVAPARPTRPFRWLYAATIVNNVGDGIALAAGPLLVASQTWRSGSGSACARSDGGSLTGRSPA
jgi:hypothetical protein